MEKKLGLLKKKAKGFTLIEMVVVIAIIAILILLIVPNLTKQRDKANDRTDDAFRTTLQTQVELSDIENPTWEKLQDKNFLTSKQVEKAKKDGYQINAKGEVEGPVNAKK